MLYWLFVKTVLAGSTPAAPLLKLGLEFGMCLYSREGTFESSVTVIMIIIYHNVCGSRRENDAVPQNFYPNAF